MKQLFLTFILFGLFTTSAFSQEEDATQAENPPQESTVQQTPAPVPKKAEIPLPVDLPSHFEYLNAKAESYNDYKVIKKSRLNDFWKVVTDSVQLLKQEISESNAQIASQQAEIASLETSAQEKQAAMEEATFDRTHITFLGIDFTKSTYITINVVLIGGLIALLVLGFLQYKYHRHNASSKIKEFDELQNAYDEFKKQALEKQIKLNRELQTERNTIEELRSKSTITKKITA